MGRLVGFEALDDYPAGDPRAAALLAAADLPADLTRAVQEGEAATGRKANFTLALAVIARRLELPRDGAADLFLMGRTDKAVGINPLDPNAMPPEQRKAAPAPAAPADAPAAATQSGYEL